MKDIILNEYDLEVTSHGDWKISESQNQSIEYLLISHQGEWKESPEAGCEIGTARYGTIDRLLDRRIRIQCEADNFKINELNITEKGIQINGNYL